ncbi:hypothetical protein BJV77DRAFT_968804 [Russula vinacea]|nr:hypothetical protein BJV77DRAFT_968804 [Russula vinacea]
MPPMSQPSHIALSWLLPPLLPMPTPNVRRRFFLPSPVFPSCQHPPCISRRSIADRESSPMPAPQKRKKCKTIIQKRKSNVFIWPADYP